MLTLLRLLLAALILWASPSFAQMNKANVQSQILLNWPDNSNNLITASKLRIPNQIIVNSYLDLNGSASFQCPTSQALIGFTDLSHPSCALITGLITNTTGTGAFVLATSPVLVTPNLGTPSALVLTNATGLPIATGVSGLGTGVATALGVAVGSAGSPVVNGGALGTPSSGVGSNLSALNADNITLGSAWTAFTATPVCGTATITTNSARWKKEGKTVFIGVDFTITAIGTCTTSLTFTLPFTPASSGGLAGREVVLANSVIGCANVGTSTSMACAIAPTLSPVPSLASPTFNSSSYFLVNYRMVATGVMESQ